MDNTDNWYTVRNTGAIDTPALLVFPERVQRNITTAISMTGDAARLRPHVKTHKSIAVVELMLKAGITRFKCATIAEAEMLGMAGAKDVLLAYQPTGPKLARFIQLLKKYPSTSYSCLVDSRTNADEQDLAFSENGLRVPVYMDLNVGMNRTGITPGTAAIDLYRYCYSLKGINIAGLHAYDGQIRNKDVAMREKECNAAFLPVLEMTKQLVSTGLPAPVIIAGGSHSFPIHCKRTSVECSPGTFVYWDKSNSDWCPEQDFLPAAVLMTRVVSLPDDQLVCIDLGHKSVAAENELATRVYLMNGPGLKAISQSEEHLVLQTGDDHYSIGDILYGLPNHVCPTVALYESMYTVEDGMVTGEWVATARNRKLTV